MREFYDTAATKKYHAVLIMQKSIPYNTPKPKQNKGVTMKTSLPLERQVYSVAEFRAVMGIGRNTAYDAIATGQVGSVRIGKRIVIPRTEVERILSAATRPAQERKAA
jgi:excisionase family DNA binding protein